MSDEPQGKSDEQTRKEFLAEYEALVKKFGLQFNATPVFVARDDGTYSIVVQWTLVPNPKVNQ